MAVDLSLLVIIVTITIICCHENDDDTDKCDTYDVIRRCVMRMITTIMVVTATMIRVVLHMNDIYW